MDLRNDNPCDRVLPDCSTALSTIRDPINIEESELIARPHDALKASGYDEDNLERFLGRTVLCLFADDTGIFEPGGVFLQFIEERTAADGADLGPRWRGCSRC